MRKLSLAMPIVVLLLSSTFSMASNKAAKFFKYVDEMTDLETYVVQVTSSNYGEYRQKGKAKLQYTCSNGSSDFVVMFPDYIGVPTKLVVRFDKNRPIQMKQISGSANNKSIFAKANTPRLAVEMLSANNVVIRGYNFQGISQSPYKFDVTDIEDMLKKADFSGGCTAISKEQKNISNEKKIAKIPKGKKIEQIKSILKNIGYYEGPISQNYNNKFEKAMLSYCNDFFISDSCTIEKVYRKVVKQ